MIAEVWREVARHEGIEETTAAVAALCEGWLLVRRWDPARSQLDTVASARLPDLLARVTLPTPRRDLVLAWARRGPGAWAGREADAVARALCPEGVAGPVAAGPLRKGDELCGFLLGPDLATLAGLLEPMAVALENDTRLHELARLREAAEQDRSALLARLAREDVSDAIVGAERGLREVMARVGQVAPTDAPVLILGETGSGKEVVARAIHAQSRRAGAPFLRVNCGAIPAELVDSELFGHEKGSFTGAIAQRKGWFERADGGTLFLDEIGELPAAAQVRLLRVLQDGSFQRVGGQQNHSVDVRIVAATHRDMGAMVRDGRFRQDLWYRISVFPIPLPALRERRGDIPALARHFAERAGLRLFGRALEPGPGEVEVLCAYDWPGNVRELAAVVERAAILGNGQGLELGAALGAPSLGARRPDDREAIEAVLRRCRGRIEGPFGAASALGVNPHTLRARMRKLGIEWSGYRG